ncbi:MAG: tetratricopeptide repeat protein [Ignavibacteriota bacterium]
MITHFIGAAAAGSDPEDVMRQVMMEIKDRYSLDDEIPTSDQAIRDEFPAWLAKIQNEKLVLAIDALNQLSGVAEELHWLPEYIPPHVRLIVSTTPGHVLDQLRKHNWNELELQPLDEPMRRRIAEEYLSHYHKTLDSDHLSAIARDPKCESPLFLRTLLEELRIFGRFATFSEHLASYLAAKDERDLFAMILERMEHDHGRDVVRSVMQAIFGSRFGLSDTELLGITSLSRLALSEFLIALEYHLMQRTGLYTFFHNYLREAVEARYANDEPEKKEIHHHIASYFSTEPYDTRRRDEEPWQWQKAENHERFKQCLTDIPMLEMLLDESRLQEIIGYWVELQKHDDLAETYHAAMEAYQEKCEDEAYFAELSGKLGNTLVSASSYKEAEIHLQASLQLQKKLFGEESLKAAESMNYLSVLYYHTGNFTEAEKLLQSVIKIRENILDKNDPLIPKAWSDLGVIFYSQGKLDEAEKYLLVALERYQSIALSNNHEIASTLGNLGAISYFRKEYDAAIDYFNKSIDIDEQIYGTNYITNIPDKNNLALAYMEIGAYEKAESILLATLSLSKSIYGNFHIATSNKYMSLGLLYARMKNYEKAIDMQKIASDISISLLGGEHYSTINILLSLGLNYYRNGEFDEGRRIINHYLPILKEKLGEGHQMYKVQESNWKELNTERKSIH